MIAKFSRVAVVKRSLAVLALSCSLSSCLLLPEYHRPEVPLKTEFRESSEQGKPGGDLKWWQVFNDPNLTRLIEAALVENRDIQVAMARIDEARAILGVTRPDQFPRLDVSGNATRTDTGDAAVPMFPPTNDFSLLGRLSFEVDIWGKFASATEAQRASLIASEEGFKAVTLSLVSQVAVTYLRLLDFDRQIIIAERTLKNRKGQTRVIGERFRGGIVAKIDLNQAEIQEQDAAATLVTIRRSQRLTENALSVLLGHTPHAITRSSPDTDPLSIHTIPTGAPASLLEQRPDVRAAEETARAAVMRVGVARSTQYPAINLIGFLGLNSSESTELFTSDGRTWSIGGSLLGPLIDLGKSWSRTDAAEAQAAQALKTYEGTVLQAVREVEDSMIALKTFHEELKIRDLQVKSAESANFISRRRYDDGVTSYLEVLNTETSLFAAGLARSNAQQNYLASVVQLYKALGGGWEIPESVQIAAQNKEPTP